MPDVQDASSASPETPLDPAEQAVANGDQAAFKEVRLAQRAGKPVPQITPYAESTPAKPAEQAAPTDATPKLASEPSKPEKKPSENNNANTRIRELVSENAALKAQLEQRTAPPDVKADPSPAKPSTREFERLKAMPDAPKIADFENFEDWSIEMAAFAAGKRLEEYSQQQKQDYDAGQFRDAQTAFDTKGLAAHADFREVLTAAAQHGRKWPEHVTRKVFTHEQGPSIAYALAKAKDDDALYQRIADPVDFGEYVAEFLAQQKLPPKPNPKTNAPDPPFTLGTRPHDSANALESAVESGDQYAFKQARLRERAASQR